MCGLIRLYTSFIYHLFTNIIAFIYQYYIATQKYLFRSIIVLKENKNSTTLHYTIPITGHKHPPSVNCLYCLFLLLLLKTQCSPEEQFLQPHSVFFIVHHTSTIKKNSQSDTISLLSPSLSKRNMCSNINVMVALKDNMKVQ